jgi:hypothetical protein
MPKMKDDRSVTLMWKTKTPKGWRYFPAVFHSRHGEYEVHPLLPEQDIGV